MLLILTVLELNTIQKKSKNLLGIMTFIRIQGYGSIMCGYFCIGFINFMFDFYTDFTNLFSPNDLKKNDDIILNYFLTNL